MASREVRVAIIDDEKLERDRLGAYFARLSAEEGVPFAVSLFSNGFDLFATCGDSVEGRFDLILLDIQMGEMSNPDMNGMRVAEAIRASDAHVPLVFVTNFEQYAIQGYSVRAMDFVVKPLSFDVFRTKMRTALERMEAARPQYLLVSNVEGLLRIPVDDIAFVEIVRRKLHVHVVERTGAVRDVGVYETLKTIEETLPSERFFRCHAAVLVNLRRVERLGKGVAQVAGIEVPVSRQHAGELARRLTNELGNMRW